MLKYTLKIIHRRVVIFKDGKEILTSQIVKELNEAQKTCLVEYTEFADYVRCRYCDCNFGKDSGVNWMEVQKQEPRCKHTDATFVCPACGFECDSFIFHTDGELTCLVDHVKN